MSKPRTSALLGAMAATFVKFGPTIRVPLAAFRKMLEDAGQKPGPNKK
jgi:hypothetical protein